MWLKIKELHSHSLVFVCDRLDEKVDLDGHQELVREGVLKVTTDETRLADAELAESCHLHHKVDLIFLLDFHFFLLDSFCEVLLRMDFLSFRKCCTESTDVVAVYSECVSG